MQLFSIAVKENFPRLSQRVKTDLAAVEKQGLCVDIGIVLQNGWEIIECNIDDCCGLEEPDSLIRHRLATVLAEFIVDELPMRLIKQMINRHYHHLSKAEKKEVLQRAEAGLKGSDWQAFNHQQKLEIIKRVGDFLGHDTHVNVQGFINFRLKTYLNKLKKLLEQSVQDFLSDREHYEFVKLLRFLVNMQSPLYEKLHVYTDCGEGFILLDENNNKVPMGTLDKDLSWDELLLSGVISSAPRRVIVHQGVAERFPRSIEILQKVFKRYLSYCNGCPFCNNKEENNKEEDDN